MAAKKKHLAHCKGLLSFVIERGTIDNAYDTFDSAKCDKSINTLIQDHSFFLVSFITFIKINLLCFYLNSMVEL